MNSAGSMYSINVTHTMHHCELPELDKQQARNMERTYELRTLKQATGRENEQDETVKNIQTNSAKG
jgi:hypothetical protein